MKAGTSYSLSNLLNRKLFYPRHIDLGSLEHKSLRIPCQSTLKREDSDLLWFGLFFTKKTFIANPFENM